MISGLILSGCSSKKSNETATAAGTSVTEKTVVPVKVITLEKRKSQGPLIIRLPYYLMKKLIWPLPLQAGLKGYMLKQVTGLRKARNYSLWTHPAFPAESSARQRGKNLSRLDTLLRMGSVTQQQYDQMKTQYDVLKTNVDFMEQNTLLRAPFGGSSPENTLRMVKCTRVHRQHNREDRLLLQ